MTSAFCQYSFWRPALAHSVIDCSPADAKFFRPFVGGHSATVQCEAWSAASIQRLLEWRGPPAIAWSVVCVVVDSIEAVRLRWLWPHVSKKGLEVVGPFLGHGYAASTILGITRRACVEAPLFSGLPASMRCRAIPAVSQKNLGRSRNGQASTTLRVLGSQVVADGRSHTSTVADALPLGPTMSVVADAVLHEKLGETLIGEVADRHCQLYQQLGQLGWC